MTENHIHIYSPAKGCITVDICNDTGIIATLRGKRITKMDNHYTISHGHNQSSFSDKGFKVIDSIGLTDRIIYRA